MVMHDRGADDVSVLIVDDSPFMRTVIGDILESAGMEVVAEAADGAEAVQLVESHRPDVVTMDIEMDGMNGLEAVERIMARCPTPIVMLSAHAADDAAVTFEALERGAVDFIAKPGGEVSAQLTAQESEIVATVRSVATADVSTDAPPGDGSSRDTRARKVPSDPALERPVTVVIGASTGGPSVVESMLRDLPARTDIRVLIAQHMPEPFTSRFANRLNETTEFTVFEGDDGLRIGRGEAVVAPGDADMAVQAYSNGRLRLTLDCEATHGQFTPSVDHVMQTAAEHVEDVLIGVILTGMGDDGVVGIREISRAGGRTYAQNEDTSAVFGMPKRAIESGAVDVVASDRSLPATIVADIEGVTAQ